MTRIERRNTGGDNNYYLVEVPDPKRLAPYTMEVDDIIESLDMTFDEGVILKALIRRCKARKTGITKLGYDGPAYDGEKIAYYGQRMVAQDKRRAAAAGATLAPAAAAQPSLSNPIELTLQWFVAAGQFQEAIGIEGQPRHMVKNPRMAAFYTGMQLEELGEKLTAILSGLSFAEIFLAAIADYGRGFKEGLYDEQVLDALDNRAEDLLDGDLDVLWVTIGAAAAQGAAIDQAYGTVAAANWAKFPGGVCTRDANGKVIKPAGWTAPSIYPFTWAGIHCYHGAS